MDSRERSGSANLPCEEPSALDAHARVCEGRGAGTPPPTRLTARLFWSGRSQAVRLPREFRLDGDVVRIRKQAPQSFLSLSLPIGDGLTPPRGGGGFLRQRARTVEPSSQTRTRRGFPVVRYLLDTNACMALLNGATPPLAARVRRCAPSDIALPAPVAYQLYYGAGKS